MSAWQTEPVLETGHGPAGPAHYSGAVSQKGLHGLCRAIPMYAERNRTARADLTPQSSTDGAARGTGTTAERIFQRALQTPGGDRRNHIAGGLCMGNAADTISRAQEDPSAPYRDSNGHQSATLCGLVVGGATLETVHVTFRPLSPSGVIRQQHLYLADQIMPRASFSPAFPLGKSPSHVCPMRHNLAMGCFSLPVNPLRKGEAYDRARLYAHVCDHPFAVRAAGRAPRHT